MSSDPPSPPAPFNNDIAALIRAGRHDEAAPLCEIRGDLAQAVLLYEKLWAFDKAWPLAERLGDWPKAVRLALDAKQLNEARRLAARVPDDDTATMLRVSESFAMRGQFDVAAQVAQRAGDLNRAAELYRRAGMPVTSAATLVTAGKLRDAGRLLQNVIASCPPTAEPIQASERAQAELMLGQLMAKVGRPWEAARALQNAAKHPSTSTEAGRYLCGILLELRLPHAAAAVARRLHAVDSGLPATPEELAMSNATEARLVPERFVVHRLLGAGGTGRVFLATDRLFEREVALKVLSVGATITEEQALARFVREAEAAGRLRNSNIVALHEFDSAAGLLIYEFVPGGSLADSLSEGEAFPLEKVRRLALELLDALSAAHHAGIIHRDVKPANVFLDAVGGAKLGDFGAAHLLDFGETQTGGLIGTLAYLSPEQVTGGHIGPQADLYGLAATLFEALTGRPPFLGPDLVSQHLSETPPTPSTLVPKLDRNAAEAIDSVLLRALAKSPEERYASARAMADAVALWPIQAANAEPAQWYPLASAKNRQPSLEDHPVANIELLGQAHKGVLLKQHETRTDRKVIVWQPDNVLTTMQLDAWRRLAGMGGPQVQRVLGLANPEGELGTLVTLEAIVGIQAPLEPPNAAFLEAEHILRKTLSAAIASEVAALAFVNTIAGPVWLVQPPLNAATETNFTPPA